ncbi:zinc finger protein 485 isoform X4 [Physeter macrocephalus]|uniref:Zinc finger protein 485 isoform X4 n=1 Tax=Physeter macrocephalus TaxID=9755 RepID=A0A9W2WD62_PHYMC|nr:zinc finger protein 485 isoform X4 [Physeter catodon]
MWLWPLPRLKGDTRCCSAGPVQGCDLLENYGNLVFVGLLSSKPKLITQLDGRAMDGSIRGSIRYLCRTLQTLQGMRIPVLRKYKYLPILGKKKTYFRLQNQAQGTLIRIKEQILLQGEECGRRCFHENSPQGCAYQSWRRRRASLFLSSLEPGAPHGHCVGTECCLCMWTFPSFLSAS